MIKMFSKNHQICLIFKIFYVSLKVDSDSEQPEKIHLWLELRIGDSSVLFFNRGAKRVPHRSSKVFKDIFCDNNILHITFRRRRMQSLKEDHCIFKNKLSIVGFLSNLYLKWII